MVRHSSLELSYVELFNPGKHGFVHGTSDPAVHGQFLALEDVDVDSWRENPETLSSAEVYRVNNIIYAGLSPTSSVIWIRVSDLFMYYCRHFPEHAGRPEPLVRNYLDMRFLRKMQGSLQIVEKHYLNGDEEVAVLKTVWLRIFQRKCRSIYNRRQTVIKNRKKIGSLLHRERTGRWPRGMQVF